MKRRRLHADRPVVMSAQRPSGAVVVPDPTAGCNSAPPEPSTGSPTVLYYSSYLRFTLVKRFLYLSRLLRVTAQAYRAADYVSTPVGSLPIKHLYYVKKSPSKLT